jgi:hypothetical protein
MLGAFALRLQYHTRGKMVMRLLLYGVLGSVLGIMQCPISFCLSFRNMYTMHALVQIKSLIRATSVPLCFCEFCVLVLFVGFCRTQEVFIRVLRYRVVSLLKGEFLLLPTNNYTSLSLSSCSCHCHSHHISWQRGRHTGQTYSCGYGWGRINTVVMDILVFSSWSSLTSQ